MIWFFVKINANFFLLKREYSLYFHVLNIVFTCEIHVTSIQHNVVLHLHLLITFSIKQEQLSPSGIPKRSILNLIRLDKGKRSLAFLRKLICFSNLLLMMCSVIKYSWFAISSFEIQKTKVLATMLKKITNKPNQWDCFVKVLPTWPTWRNMQMINMLYMRCNVLLCSTEV